MFFLFVLFRFLFFVFVFWHLEKRAQRKDIQYKSGSDKKGQWFSTMAILSPECTLEFSGEVLKL